VSLALLLGVLSIVASTALESPQRTPGGQVSELLAVARRECLNRAPARVPVPLVALTWVCERGEPPRVEGKLPRDSGQLSAGRVELSDDLRQAAFEQLRAELGVSELRVQLHVARATVRGLPPWGRPRSHSLGARFAWLAASALLTALLVALLGARVASLGRAGRLALALGASLALWLALGALDREDHGAARFFLLPAAGLAGAAVSALLWAGAARLIAVRRAGW
jgi:hypothetical protein